jgi:hypothetical protein
MFSNDGRFVRRVEVSQLSDVVNRAATRRNDMRRSRGFLLAEPEFVLRTREGIRQVLAVPLKNRKSDFTLTLAVLDAMSAASEAEAHQLLAKLPIRVERKIEAGTVTTSVYVRGNIKFTAATPLPATHSQETGPSASLEVADTPSEGAEASPSVLAAPYVVPEADCEIDPEDPCATQQNIDDALAAEAALQSDLDSAAGDFSVDEAACYADGCCSYVPTTPGPAVETQSCGWRYLEAGIGLAWAAGGIASAVAVTISPDPVSKLAIFGAYANAAAGVGAAILGVRDAWNCHYDLMYAPVSWTGLRIDRPQFVLKPVFTGSIWA